MFCGKCGKQIPDGSICDCQQELNQPQESPEEVKAQPVTIAGLSISKLIGLGIAVLTFLLHFIKWYSVSMETTIFGQTISESEGVSAYAADMGEVSFILAFAKFILVVNIFVFLAYVASAFIDVKKIPVIANLPFDFHKLAGLAFFGLMAFALLLGLIGSFTAEMPSVLGLTPEFGISFGWVITLIFTGAGLVNIFMPDLLGNVVSGFLGKK